MADFSAGDRVKYRGMSMPAKVLSGPHQSFGVDRYLIQKADGNVSLVPGTQMERIPSRADRVAEHLSRVLYGRGFQTLSSADRARIASIARDVVTIADTREA